MLPLNSGDLNHQLLFETLKNFSAKYLYQTNSKTLLKDNHFAHSLNGRHITSFSYLHTLTTNYAANNNTHVIGTDMLPFLLAVSCDNAAIQQANVSATVQNKTKQRKKKIKFGKKKKNEVKKLHENKSECMKVHTGRKDVCGSRKYLCS